MRPQDFRIISIGTLALHPLWNEATAARTGHATTTLITAGDAHVLVDPSLPGRVVEARLSERSPVSAAEITHVFLTSFTPEHSRGLGHFHHAEWHVHEPEREAARLRLDAALARAGEAADADLTARLQTRRALLERCRNATDTIVRGVDLFPLPGVTPGTCGLLLPLPTTTVLICGDAVATIEHLRQGKVLPTCADLERARASFREALDIADVLVPGRDNVTENPMRSMM